VYVKRTGCRRLLALIAGLPEDAAVWRQDKPGWSQQDELLATVAEAIDAWGRQIVLAVQCGPLKRPQLPPALVDLQHPDRPRRDATKAPDQAGSSAGSPARSARQIDVAAARRFFGQQGIRSGR
jgi:hypothetical protein